MNLWIVHSRVAAPPKNLGAYFHFRQMSKGTKIGELLTSLQIKVGEVSQVSQRAEVSELEAPGQVEGGQVSQMCEGTQIGELPTLG